MKKYRVLLLLGCIFSCLFSMDMIFGSRVYFRNMYSEHFVYDFNIYSQVISIGLLGFLFLLLLVRKSKPYYFTIVGAVTVLLNVISMVLYSSIVQDFYFNIYSIRGVVLVLIGISLQSKKIEIVKLLSMYFFLELLILQVTSMSDDSIFFMHKTFEANLLGAVIMFVLGLFIPLCMTYLLTESTVSSESTIRKPIKIESVLRITSLISVGYLGALIIMNIPYLFGTLIDASRITIIYYQVSALLRIALYSLLIYTFISLIRDNIKKWMFPVITIVIFVTIIFPLTIDIQFYLERFYWLYGVTIDLVLLVILTVFIYLKKYNISFYVSMWFLLNFLLGSLRIGNIQSIIIFNNSGYYNFEIFVQILYYFIPISLILVQYNRMKSQKETF